MRHIPYNPLPQYDLLKQQENLDALYALDGSAEYLDACTCNQYVEVWYSKKTMNSVNRFIANGCQFVPEQSNHGSRTFGSFTLDILLFILEFIESLVMFLWLARLYLGQEYLLRIIEVSCLLVPEKVHLILHCNRLLQCLFYLQGQCGTTGPECSSDPLSGSSVGRNIREVAGTRGPLGIAFDQVLRALIFPRIWRRVPLDLERTALWSEVDDGAWWESDVGG